MEKDAINALALLEEDHRRVRKAFRDYEWLWDKSFSKKKELADEICSELTIHTKIEEKLFYPTVRESIKEASELLDQANVEHKSAKDLISDIKSMSVDDPLFDSSVKVLSEQIEHHLMEEEWELFPMVRKSNIDIVSLWRQMLEMKQKEEWSFLKKIMW
ncbi:MAG: hypothetical protein ACD_2C00104G0001 [uncultured bacterium (gcode 4)]|uniref:Hemerythrin-like domain-containing protein n=1 Tax=uncultured bacterium (gcode 4) TaxID=1234023 RepID=K2G3G7_9BACT|nr:MAG: hypothetical protein ACD_2C00104G0001 [uncultured bacterium (gcode 4)]